ncbi:MAG TPA: sigma-70 family RNA polymerase sigma factor [Longimicrobiales bacterium]|nr:sigma-70 family RNA polymerase sigma factor [Longimicrobiales bacterium]
MVAQSTRPHDPSPIHLVRGMARGDERALAALYDRYAPAARSLALAILRDEADAEEVAAEAFAQAWRLAPRFDPERGSPAVWLTTITRSRALDRLRARRRLSCALEHAAALAPGTPVMAAAPSPPPDRAVEADELRCIVGRSLAELPELQRQCLELAYFAGLSHSEIARELDEPLGTVKTRIRSGLIRLRAALAGLGRDGGYGWAT